MAMSATVYAAARYGVVNDNTATGLHLASFSTNSEVDEAFALNHGGSTIGYSMYNDRATVDVSGVVAVKATGLALNLASVLALANVTADSLNTTTGNLFTTSVGNAGLLVKSVSLTRTNTGFEEGSIGGVYFPLVATNSPSTLAD
jgi:hypothetical protein